MDWAGLDFEKIANAIVILVVGLAAGLGLKSGKRAAADLPAPVRSGTTMEFAGALIDSSSAKQLAAAIEGQTLEAINGRKSFDRGVEEMCDVLKDTNRALEAVKTELARKG